MRTSSLSLGGRRSGRYVLKSFNVRNEVSTGSGSDRVTIFATVISEW